MALKLNTSVPTDRSDLFHVDPADITFSLNSRGESAEPTDDEVKALAVSIYQEGQKVPCTAHRDGDKKVIVDGGRCRVAAVNLIRKGFDFKDGDGFEVTAHAPDLKVALLIDEKVRTDEDAFRASVLENLRAGVTDLQESEAHTILRERWSYTDKQIQNLYGYTNNNRVARLKALAEAPAAVKALVKKGTSLDTALTISKIEDPEARKAQIEKAKEGKVTTREVLDAIGKQEEEKEAKAPKATEGDETPEPKAAAVPGTIRARNASHFIKLLDEEADKFSFDANVVLRAVGEWLAGRAKTSRGLHNALAKVGLAPVNA